MPPKVHPIDTDTVQYMLRNALCDPLQTNMFQEDAIVSWVVKIAYLLIGLVEGLIHEIVTWIDSL